MIQEDYLLSEADQLYFEIFSFVSIESDISKRDRIQSSPNSLTSHLF